MFYRLMSMISRTNLRVRFLFCVFVVLSAFLGGLESRAQIIRDAEVENALRVYIQPLLEVSGLSEERLNLTIINNDEINAAVLPGGHSSVGQIIVHTGLLTKSESPLEVAGVLAHELGHYLNHDLFRLTENQSNFQRDNLLGIALGLGLAVAGGDSSAVVAGGLVGQQVAGRNQLAFTRSMETGADRRAVALLYQADLGVAGLVELSQRMLNENPDPQFAGAEYMRTHPLSENRLSYYQGQLDRMGARAIPDGWQALHDRIRAKLMAFTQPPSTVLVKYPMIRNDVPARIARSIAMMRQAQYDQAIVQMQSLIVAYPQDGFLYDLLGDIYRQSGEYPQAIVAYGKAINILPWASAIRYQRAQLWLRQNDQAALESAKTDLLQALRYEPDVPAYWYDLAEIHKRLDAPAEAQMALAEAAMTQMNIPLAAGHAQKVKQLSPSDSSLWLRADDITQQFEALR